MTNDKASAVWVSHSSISDFLACPRAYYLKNIYRNPKTGNKIQRMSPPLALGQVIHHVVESLSSLPTKQRFATPLLQRYTEAWENVSGKRGGFFSKETEQQYKHRGETIIRRVMNNPGPLERLSVKINMDLPQYWLSKKDGIILCGKIDWLEYLPDINAVHIIDFKTGSGTEPKDSLQLPIYYLLTTKTQKYPVDSVSYWYLDRCDTPTKQDVPDIETAHKDVLRIAKKIKLARQLESFKCTQGDKQCYACKPFEQIIAGSGEYVGIGEYGNDIFVLEEEINIPEGNGVIL